MLKRIKSKSWKPLCLGKKANVLITKTDLWWWFKIAVFVKNWATVFSDWFRPENDWLDYNLMSSEEFRDRQEKKIIEEVKDILEEEPHCTEEYDLVFPRRYTDEDINIFDSLL